MLVLLLFQGIRYLLLSLPLPGTDEDFRTIPGALIWVDSLKGIAQSGSYNFVYNPNTLGDYQGYMLGLRPEVIDRLITYRIRGKKIKSKDDFQRVTGISDSAMQRILPRLRFANSNAYKREDTPGKATTVTPVVRDLNAVTASELRVIRGIGPVLSERIVNFRNRLNGFQVNAQLYHVYGLDSTVADRILLSYQVLDLPAVEMINVNEASADELTRLVYLNWRLARRIVAWRDRNGPFENLNELTKIEDFPKDKIDQIKLYLSL